MSNLRVCLVCSTLGVPCGIGDYTNSLAKALDRAGADVLLINNIKKGFNSIINFKPDIVNIQFEYSLYPIADLNRFLNKLRRYGIISAITMHGWSDLSVEENNVIENKADRIIVLNDRFRRRLIERGNSPDKVMVIPMGFRQFKLEERAKVRARLRIPDDRKVVGMFGFFEPWKRFDKGAKAVALLQKKYHDNISLLVRSFSKGYEMAKEAEKIFGDVVKSEGVDVIEIGARDMYLPLEKIASALHACDVLLYPYQELFTYSSSAAIRDGISSFVPVVASDIPFFGDIPDGCVLKVRSCSYRDMAAAIMEIFENEKLREEMIKNQRELVEKYSWDNVAKLFIKSIPL